jgi:hypothetical protein
MSLTEVQPLIQPHANTLIRFCEAGISRLKTLQTNVSQRARMFSTLLWPIANLLRRKAT